MGWVDSVIYAVATGQVRPFVDPLWFPRKQTYSGRDLGPDREGPYIRPRYGRVLIL